MLKKEMKRCHADRIFSRLGESDDTVDMVLRGVLPNQMGRSIEALRRAKGISQADFAKACGFHKSYICQLESGVRTPSKRTILTLSRALCIPSSVLLDLTARHIPDNWRANKILAAVHLTLMDEESLKYHVANKVLPKCSNQ